ncbi:MAG: type II secretion system F family protein [Sulfurihydrogenibium sp.]|jgi:type IV pilus assembly protein PilC|nr:type II secretion system F family protein [Sulfurihydrogenibium sp.]
MKFVYEGYLEGKKVKGEVEANTKQEVIKKLKEEGIAPVKIEELKRKISLSFKKEKPSDEDLAFILLQIDTYLKSGFQLTKALEIVSSQTEDKNLSAGLLKIKTAIESGKSVSQAFKESKLFPEFFSLMLESAQTGENLEMIFKITSDYLLSVSSIKNKVISALIYPAVILIFSVISVFVATNYVIPKIISVLQSFGKEPPLITKAILIFAKIFNFLIFLTPILIIAYFFKDRFIKKEVFDKHLLKIPIVGKLILYFNLSRFAKVLSLSLKSNTPIQNALTYAINSIGNSYLRQQLMPLIEDVSKGSNISKSIRKVKELPTLFITLLETGESSGELEKMLDTIANVYDSLIERIIDRWMKLIEPIMMLIIGAVIGIIILSVILPIMDISTTAKLK